VSFAPCQSPFWRIAITDLDSVSISLLDRVASNRHIEALLNVPNWLSFRVPSDDPLVTIPYESSNSYPYVAEGVRHVYAFRQESDTAPYFTVRAAGTILQIQDSAEADDATSQVVAFDPWKMLYARNAQNLAGELPDQTGEGGAASAGYWDGVYAPGTEAGDVILDQLKNTITNDGIIHVDAGAAYGGTAFYAGTIQPTLNLTGGWTVEQGKMVGEVWADMVANANCDIILRPIFDPVDRPGYTHELNIYSFAGQDRPDAILGWNLPPRSISQIDRSVDGTQRANEIMYAAGMGGRGGRTNQAAAASDAISQALFGKYSAQQFFPGNDTLDSVRAWADLQLELRKDGRTIVQVWPNPDRSPCPFVEVDLGDRVPVYASGDEFRQDLAGYVRVYGMPIDISDDALESVGGMLLVPQT